MKWCCWDQHYAFSEGHQPTNKETQLQAWEIFVRNVDPGKAKDSENNITLCSCNWFLPAIEGRFLLLMITCTMDIEFTRVNLGLARKPPPWMTKMMFCKLPRVTGNQQSYLVVTPMNHNDQSCKIFLQVQQWYSQLGCNLSLSNWT